MSSLSAATCLDWRKYTCPHVLVVSAQCTSRIDLPQHRRTASPFRRTANPFRRTASPFRKTASPFRKTASQVFLPSDKCMRRIQNITALRVSHRCQTTRDRDTCAYAGSVHFPTYALALATRSPLRFCHTYTRAPCPYNHNLSYQNSIPYPIIMPSQMLVMLSRNQECLESTLPFMLATSPSLAAISK